MVDHEQIRRDAEAAAAWMPDLPWAESRHYHPAGLALPQSPSGAFCDAVTPDVVLALLDEQQQAEKERDERTPHWGVDRDAYEAIGKQLDAAEARLSRVPALVEAVRPFARFADLEIDEMGWTSREHRGAISTWFGPSDFRAIQDALAAFEAERGEG